MGVCPAQKTAPRHLHWKTRPMFRTNVTAECSPHAVHADEDLSKVGLHGQRRPGNAWAPVNAETTAEAIAMGLAPGWYPRPLSTEQTPVSAHGLAQSCKIYHQGHLSVVAWDISSRGCLHRHGQNVASETSSDKGSQLGSVTSHLKVPDAHHTHCLHPMHSNSSTNTARDSAGSFACMRTNHCTFVRGL